MPFTGPGIWLLGPTLIHWGNAAQKECHLRKVLSGEELWCQGYSEPNAGSDLAALQTRAVQDGDHFIVNGSKNLDLARASRALDVLARAPIPPRPNTKGSVICWSIEKPGYHDQSIDPDDRGSSFQPGVSEDVACRWRISSVSGIRDGRSR